MCSIATSHYFGDRIEGEVAKIRLQDFEACVIGVVNVGGWDRALSGVGLRKQGHWGTVSGMCGCRVLRRFGSIRALDRGKTHNVQSAGGSGPCHPVAQLSVGHFVCCSNTEDATFRWHTDSSGYLGESGQVSTIFLRIRTFKCRSSVPWTIRPSLS